MEENKFEFRNVAHQYLAAITGEIPEKCLKFILTDKVYFFISVNLIMLSHGCGKYFLQFGSKSTDFFEEFFIHSSGQSWAGFHPRLTFYSLM